MSMVSEALCVRVRPERSGRSFVEEEPLEWKVRGRFVEGSWKVRERFVDGSWKVALGEEEPLDEMPSRRL